MDLKELFEKEYKEALERKEETKKTVDDMLDEFLDYLYSFLDKRWFGKPFKIREHEDYGVCADFNYLKSKFSVVFIDYEEDGEVKGIVALANDPICSLTTRNTENLPFQLAQETIKCFATLKAQAERKAMRRKMAYTPHVTKKS